MVGTHSVLLLIQRQTNTTGKHGPYNHGASGVGWKDHIFWGAAHRHELHRLVQLETTTVRPVRCRANSTTTELETGVRSRFGRNAIRGAAVSCLMLSCTSQAGQGPPGTDVEMNLAAVVLQGAQDVQSLSEYDGGVTYRLISDFPARPVIESLEKRLERDGWSQAREDIFNPSRPVGDPQWALLENRTGKVFSWTSQWKNANGTVLLVNLQSAVSGVSGDLKPSDQLTVKVLRFSPETSDRIRRGLRR